MFAETMISDSYFNNLAELAQDPFLPPVTSSCNALPTEKRSTMIENDGTTTMQPPLKRMRITAPSVASPTAPAAIPFHRIPCKARGMSNKHNSETAFIDVPVDAPHGLLLSCSNIECAQSGRKFRYCKVCALPVAKRNFPKRHGHGLIHFAKDLKEVDYISTFVTPSNGEPSCQPCDPSKIVPQPAQIEKPRLHRRTVSVDQSRQQQQVHEQQMMPPPAAPVIIPRSNLQLGPDEKDWIALLHERPDLEAEDKMSKWMDKVIGFSAESSSTRSSPRQPQQIVRIPTTPPAPSTALDARTAAVITPPVANPLSGNNSILPTETPNPLGKASESVNPVAVCGVDQSPPTIDGVDPVFANVDMMRLFE